jgi:hypothetical protein
MINRAVRILRYKQPFVDWINAADPNPGHQATLNSSWYTDPELWPRNRSAALFKKWCMFELHTLVQDTGCPPIVDDEM